MDGPRGDEDWCCGGDVEMPAAGGGGDANDWCCGGEGPLPLLVVWAWFGPVLDNRTSSEVSAKMLGLKVRMVGVRGVVAAAGAAAGIVRDSVVEGSGCRLGGSCPRRRAARGLPRGGPEGSAGDVWEGDWGLTGVTVGGGCGRR